jgi:hypothetical protein
MGMVIIFGVIKTNSMDNLWTDREKAVVNGRDKMVNYLRVNTTKTNATVTEYIIGQMVTYTKDNLKTMKETVSEKWLGKMDKFTWESGKMGHSMVKDKFVPIFFLVQLRSNFCSKMEKR